MRDIILISKSYSIEYFNLPLDEQPEGTFSIHYIRIKNQSSIDHIIQKKPLQNLPNDEIVMKGEIKNNEGQIGSLSIDTEEEARQIIENELKDENSEIRKKNFDKNPTIIVVDLDEDIARIVDER